MLDTGSEITLITKKLAEKLNLNLKSYNGVIPVAANGKTLPILGEAKITIRIADEESALMIKTKVQVIEKLPKYFEILLGHDILSEAGIIIDCSTGQVKIKIKLQKIMKLQKNHQIPVQNQKVKLKVKIKNLHPKFWQ